MKTLAPVDNYLTLTVEEILRLTGARVLIVCAEGSYSEPVFSDALVLNMLGVDQCSSLYWKRDFLQIPMCLSPPILSYRILCGIPIPRQ